MSAKRICLDCIKKLRQDDPVDTLSIDGKIVFTVSKCDFCGQSPVPIAHIKHKDDQSTTLGNNSGLPKTG